MPLLIPLLAACAGHLHAGDDDTDVAPAHTDVYVPHTGHTGAVDTEPPGDGAVDPHFVDPDACPSFVVPLTPRSGQTGVSRTPAMVVGFREIDAERWARVMLHDADGEVALGVPVWTDDHRQVTVLPEEPLAASTPHVLRVTLPCWTATHTTEVPFVTGP